MINPLSIFSLHSRHLRRDPRAVSSNILARMGAKNSRISIPKRSENGPWNCHIYLTTKSGEQLQCNASLWGSLYGTGRSPLSTGLAGRQSRICSTKARVPPHPYIPTYQLGALTALPTNSMDHRTASLDSRVDSPQTVWQWASLRSRWPVSHWGAVQLLQCLSGGTVLVCTNIGVHEIENWPI